MTANADISLSPGAQVNLSAATFLLPVPEPTSALLLSLAAPLLLRRRRRS
jgi:hypothetical protein